MKLHKEGFPLRDISDASQSPGHKLAKILNKLFAGYTGKSKHHLNSHSDLVDIIRSGKYDSGFGISFDAVELYPSIIISDALQLLEELKSWNLLEFLSPHLISNVSWVSLNRQKGHQWEDP